MIDLTRLLAELAMERPIFHSEADFQHALAWKLHELQPEARIRLEYRPFPEERVYLDIWLAGQGQAVAIELKYLPQKFDAQVDGERFHFKEQAAHSLGRYDFLKDLVRIERVVVNILTTFGYAILLTNDALYWKPAARPINIDVAFQIHEGRTIGGTFAWAAQASAGSKKGRESDLVIRGTYELHWQDYSAPSAGAYGRFRYLLVPVSRSALSETVTPPAQA